LSLNVKKTNYILFANKRLPNVDKFINKQVITREYETTFLGVIIPQQHRLKVACTYKLDPKQNIQNSWYNE